MINKKLLLDTNLFSIFTFILIVSANFLAELFPCNLQYLLKNNMVVKHIFGVFTMIFFVRLVSKTENDNINNIFLNSILLYLYFVILSRCHINIFYIIFGLICVSYLVHLYKDISTEKLNLLNTSLLEEGENGKNNKNNKNKTNKVSGKEYEELKTRINFLNDIEFVLYIIIIILTVFGMMVYMGEKKLEYKNNFNYYTFFLGNINCKHKSPNSSILKSFKQNFI